MQLKELNEKIAPFTFMIFDENADDVWASFILYAVGDYLQDVFDTRADEGFEGNGYDWNSLALVFMEEKMPSLKSKLNFEPESSMFCVRSSDVKALEKFALGFKALCDDLELVTDLFSRAELDQEQQNERKNYTSRR